MKTSRFITSKQFEEMLALMKSKRAATRTKYHKLVRQTVVEVTSRWSWLCRGHIGLPFPIENVDLIEQTRMFLGAAKGIKVPEFPLHPREYKKTAGQVYAMLPQSLREEMQTPQDPAQPVIWGKTALGGVPYPYAHPDSGYRGPGSWWGTVDPVGNRFNDFDLWILEQEHRIYFGTLLSENPQIWSGGDPLADRRIRAFYVGYRLSRSNGWGKEDILWEGKNLPISVLSWWLRYWTRAVDNGVWIKHFSRSENREKTFESGLQAIAANGGWPEYADPWANMGDWTVAVEFDGKSVPINLMMGTLGVSEELLEQIGGEENLDKFFQTASKELGRFGFKTQPILF